MMIYIVVLVATLCFGRDQDCNLYTKNVNQLLDAWIKRPSDTNFRHLQFYMHHYRPVGLIQPVTHKTLTSKLSSIQHSNAHTYKLVGTCATSVVCTIAEPSLCAGSLMGCAIVTGKLFADCHQANKKGLADEIKKDLHHIVKQSHLYSKIPLPLIMKEDE